MDIMPTHSCFDDALDLIQEIITQNLKDKDELLHSLILVHAICLMPNSEPYAHAWVEDKKTGQCMFKGILNGQLDCFAANRDEYYKEMKVQEVTRYTVMQAAKENERHGNYGPWKRRYKILCRNFAP